MKYDFNYKIAEDQNIKKGNYVLYTNPHPQSRLKNVLLKVGSLHTDSEGNECFNEVTKYLTLTFRKLAHATKVINLDELNNELVNELLILKKDLIDSGYTETNPNSIEVINDAIKKLSF